MRLYEGDIRAADQLIKAGEARFQALLEEFDRVQRLEWASGTTSLRRPVGVDTNNAGACNDDVRIPGVRGRFHQSCARHKALARGPCDGEEGLRAGLATECLRRAVQEAAVLLSAPPLAGSTGALANSLAGAGPTIATPDSDFEGAGGEADRKAGQRQLPMLRGLVAAKPRTRRVSWHGAGSRWAAAPGSLKGGRCSAERPRCAPVQRSAHGVVCPLARLDSFIGEGIPAFPFGSPAAP